MGACLGKEPGKSFCDLGGSLFGEDVFYRDAFVDCEEGGRSDDYLFARAREQARLKYRKGSLVAEYASFQMKKQASLQPLKSACQVFANPREPLKSSEAASSSFDKQSSKPALDSGECQVLPSWFSRTIDEWKDMEFPKVGSGPYWSKGNGEGLRVRCGPDYKKNGCKTESRGAMYHALTCDAVRSKFKIQNVIADYMKGHLPDQPQDCAESERGGGSALPWTRDCPLPRVICVNMMLPYTTGTFGSTDAGCSFVGLFHITPETIKGIKSSSPPACLRLFKEFWEGPAGLPGGDNQDPNR
mmetsp:Transcript_6872/g.25664  ORF Transcript_6872/g.25664 Transcript_6872/m.25664 type:complete len:300 (+) Transcript_6872:132-1031(+)